MVREMANLQVYDGYALVEETLCPRLEHLRVSLRVVGGCWGRRRSGDSVRGGFRCRRRGCLLFLHRAKLVLELSERFMSTSLRHTFSTHLENPQPHSLYDLLRIRVGNRL